MATINSNVGTFDSNTTAAWSGGVIPVDGDKVNIVSGSTITVVGTHVWGDDTSTGLNIKGGGTLKASRASNSTLTVKGQFVVENLGVLDYGTNASPIPVGVVATIKLNYSASLTAGEWGLELKDTAYCYMYGAAKTTNTFLSADIAIGATTARVLDATGWQVGDRVILGPTGSVTTAADVVMLTSVTPVSGTVADIAWTGGTTYAHAAKGLVGNFTNSVVLTAHNPTYGSWFYNFWNTTAADNSREFRYITFEDFITSTSGSFWKQAGFTFYNGNSSNLKDPHISIGNLAFYQPSTAQASLQYGNHKARLTISDVAIYNYGTGMSCFQGAVADMRNIHVYRATAGTTHGYSEGMRAPRFYDCYFTGCTSQCHSFGGSVEPQFYDCYHYASAYAVFIQVANAGSFKNCYFGVGPNTPVGATFSNTYFIHAQIGSIGSMSFNDCSFDTSKTMTNDVSSGYLAALPSLTVRVSNKNLDPLLQEIYTPVASLVRDNSFYRTGSPSVRVDCKAATAPFTFDINVFAPNGKPVVVSGYIQKNAAYGSSNLPFVTLSGLGITPDVFTISDIDDVWQQFVVQGTQNSGTDGMLTVTFQIQAAAGSVWIDDVVAPVATAVNVGEFGYWANALPVQAVLANFVSANDVWNLQTDQLTLEGSIGKKVLELPSDVRKQLLPFLL